jgi:CubicO group peptidase (beta-lactamase class C family)
VTPGTASRRALEELTAKRAPGLALVVVRDGRPAGTGASGVADLESGAAMTPETIQPWFSMTKIVTATAAMQLVERGELGLDDPVTSFLPQFPEPRSGWPQVRVRHLLSHSSGLANPIPVRWVHPRRSPAPTPASSPWSGSRPPGA